MSPESVRRAPEASALLSARLTSVPLATIWNSDGTLIRIRAEA